MIGWRNKAKIEVCCLTKRRNPWYTHAWDIVSIDSLFLRVTKVMEFGYFWFRRLRGFPHIMNTDIWKRSNTLVGVRQNHRLCFILFPSLDYQKECKGEKSRPSWWARFPLLLGQSLEEEKNAKTSWCLKNHCWCWRLLSTDGLVCVFRNLKRSYFYLESPAISSICSFNKP